MVGFGLILTRVPTFLELAVGFAVVHNVAPLAAAFCVVGPSRWWVRVCLTSFVLALFFALWIPFFSPPSWVLWVLLVQFVGVAALLCVPRSLGWRLETPDAGASRDPVQFTLRHLGGWMVGCALLLAVWLQFQRWVDPDELAQAGSLAFIASLAPVCLLRPAFDRHINPLRWGLALLPILVAGVGIAVAFHQPGSPAHRALEPLIFLLVQAGVALGVYLPVRRYGLRWVHG